MADTFADLPQRYRDMPAGDLVTEEQARTWSIGASVVALALLGGFAYLMFSQEAIEGPQRREKLRRLRAELAQRERRR